MRRIFESAGFCSGFSVQHNRQFKSSHKSHLYYELLQSALTTRVVLGPVLRQNSLGTQIELSTYSTVLSVVRNDFLY